MYKCISCGKEISEEQLRGRIRCMYCGFRILMKKRPNVIKKVEAK
ncbi:MAG: DNA-directed RNA polymerase subunit P [Candidatus Aenigmatarchaeota archaeon]|nr:DNA-directed RNA polymerase subunit P [Candidatus Aenigmarchaeota archaeon]